MRNCLHIAPCIQSIEIEITISRRDMHMLTLAISFSSRMRDLIARSRDTGIIHKKITRKIHIPPFVLTLMRRSTAFYLRKKKRSAISTLIAARHRRIWNAVTQSRKLISSEIEIMRFRNTRT